MLTLWLLCSFANKMLFYNNGALCEKFNPFLSKIVNECREVDKRRNITYIQSQSLVHWQCANNTVMYVFNVLNWLWEILAGLDHHRKKRNAQLQITQAIIIVDIVKFVTKVVCIIWVTSPFFVHVRKTWYLIITHRILHIAH